MSYPKPFEDLIDSFRLLPGVGAKTAERYAYQLLELREDKVQDFMNAIKDSYYSIHACKICGNLTINDTCDICQDETRDQSTICVVTRTKDLLAIQRCQDYRGLYHVLGGEISSTKGIMPDDINIKGLLDRINDETKEIILATNPTVDGETTALYIAKLLEKHPLSVTRLAHGLPMGGNLDYADELTLSKALEGRKRL